MKTEKVMRNLTLIAGVALVGLLPAPCRAQAEVTPDFYELSNTEATMTAQQEPTAKRQQQAAEFQGKVSLPYAIECSGKSLTPGQYSVSVKTDGTNRLVSIRRNGQVVSVVAREASQSAANGQSALLVRRAGRAHKLQAVYVEELNVVLYLDAAGKAGDAFTSDRVPIT